MGRANEGALDFADSRAMLLGEGWRTASVDNVNVILVGGDHHNGLGLVRSFGRHGIKPFGIIVKPGGDSFVAKSKYWADVELLEDNSQIVPMLLGAYRSLSENRIVVIPWSDGAAKVIDENLDVLNAHFALPSIGGKQGEIARLMDKAVQTEFMAERGIGMLPSEIVFLGVGATTRISLPVILKPVTSVEGGKSDMRICRNAAEYSTAIGGLESAGFSRILVQKYLPECEEYVVDGAVTGEGIAYSVVKSIRKWPEDFGTGSFSESVVDARINCFCKDVLRAIAAVGYRGPIDFEFFADSGGALYVNEVNWRSSGRNFVSRQTNVHAAFNYYCNVTGRSYDGDDVNEAHGFNMNEITDFVHVIKREITISNWLRDVKRADCYAIWDRDDMRPFLAKCEGAAMRFITRKVSL